MKQESHFPPAVHAPDVESMVEHAAKNGLPMRKWPAPLRALWHAELPLRGRQDLAFINALGLVAVLLCVPLDYSVGSRTFAAGLVLRVGIVVPAYLLAIYAALRCSWPIRRLVSIVPPACFATVATFLGTFQGGAEMSSYLMGAALIVLMATAVLPLRAGMLSMMVGLSLAGMWTVWAMLPLSPPVSGESRALLAYLTATMLVALALPIRTDRMKDRAFLSDLRSRFVSERLVAANAQLRELSHRDDLTGLPNRRYFQRIFGSALEDSIKRGDGLAVMMIDVDRFKHFNDSHGHLAGDRALRQIAAQLERHFASLECTVARYGGEEFIALVERCDAAHALALAETVRQAVEGRPVPTGQGAKVPVTLSIGVAIREGADTAPGDLVARADSALYEAKESGRNRVRLAGHAPDAAASQDGCRPASRA
ncbi:GGDEF domain-containing protein [Citromicrobium bathyomarinum]|uniref:GGDEF domain-containing protein n=1 Tax=Citromicrobium bathyomarinum TaxID=72174 RepID=UPI00315A34FC